MKASSLIEGVCEADAAGKGEVRQNLARIVVELVFSAASGGRTRERVNPGPAHPTARPMLWRPANRIFWPRP